MKYISEWNDRIRNNMVWNNWYSKHTFEVKTHYMVRADGHRFEQPNTGRYRSNSAKYPFGTKCILVSIRM